MFAGSDALRCVAPQSLTRRPLSPRASRLLAIVFNENIDLATGSVSANSQYHPYGRLRMPRALALLQSYTAPALSSSSLRNILNTDKPSILSQCFQDLPAITKWPQTSYLRKFADHPIEIEVSPHDAPGYGERHEISLGAYLEMLNHQLPYRVYMAQFPLFEQIPHLQADVTTPLVDEILQMGEKYSTSTWIGKKSLTPLHHDPKALTNLFIQICGRKRVRMFPPESDRGRLRVGEGTLRNTSMVDVWTEEVNIGDGFEGTVEAGDGLIIPRGWWHSVRSDEDLLNISVNWWFKMRN